MQDEGAPGSHARHRAWWRCAAGWHDGTSRQTIRTDGLFLVWSIRNPGNAGCSMLRQIFAINRTCAIRHLARAVLTTPHTMFPCSQFRHLVLDCERQRIRTPWNFLGAFTAASSSMPDRQCGRVEDRVMTVRPSRRTSASGRWQSSTPGRHSAGRLQSYRDRPNA